MKDSYSEGLATRADSESCIFVRKGASEALTGVRAGQVWSREIEPPSRQRWPLWGADAVELEIPCLSVGEGSADRIGKSKDVPR